MQPQKYHQHRNLNIDSASHTSVVEHPPSIKRKVLGSNFVVVGKSGCRQMQILCFRKIMGFISADDPHGEIEANNSKAYKLVIKVPD